MICKSLLSVGPLSSFPMRTPPGRSTVRACVLGVLREARGASGWMLTYGRPRLYAVQKSDTSGVFFFRLSMYFTQLFYVVLALRIICMATI